MPSETVTQSTSVAVEPRSLESLTPNQYNEWRKTGEIPNEEPAKKEPASPATEKKAEVEDKTAEHTEVKQPEQKPSKMGYGELRKQLRERDAEIERLKANTREAVEEPKTPEPKAEKKEARPRQADVGQDGKPKYQNWEEYEDALRKVIDNEYMLQKAQIDNKLKLDVAGRAGKGSADAEIERLKANTREAVTQNLLFAALNKLDSTGV
jgi:hypothetical protein